MVYCVHAALFWKSMVVLEEFVVEFVQHPLDMSETIWSKRKAFIVGLYWKHFSKQKLSKWRLDWSTKGTRTHVKQK